MIFVLREGLKRSQPSAAPTGGGYIRANVNPVATAEVCDLLKAYNTKCGSHSDSAGM
jgi:hypothetical protein